MFFPLLIFLFFFLSFNVFASTSSDRNTSIYDSCIGFSPELVNNSETLEIAKKEVSEQIEQELISWKSALEQVKRYFFDPILEGNQEAITTMKALDEFLRLKIQKTEFMQAFFATYQGVNIPQIDSPMQELPKSIGRYRRIFREMEMTSYHLKELEKKKRQIIKAQEDLKNDQNQLHQFFLSKRFIRKKLKNLKHERAGILLWLENLGKKNIFLSEKMKNLTPDDLVLNQLKNERSLNSQLQEQLIREQEAILEVKEQEEKDLRNWKEKIKTLQDKIESIPREDSSKKQILEIDEQIKKLQDIQECLQSKADSYALIKCISYQNIIDALPTEDLQRNLGDVQLCTVIDPFIEDLLLKSLSSKMSEKISQSILEKFRKTLLKEKVTKELAKAVAIILPPLMHNYSPLDLDDSEGDEIAKKMKTTCIEKGDFSFLSKLLSSYMDDALKELPNFSQGQIHSIDKSKLETYRVDLFLKKRLNDWHNRISRRAGGILDQLGLLNFNFKSQNLFSFKALLSDIKGEGVKTVVQVDPTEYKKLFSRDKFEAAHYAFLKYIQYITMLHKSKHHIYALMAAYEWGKILIQNHIDFLKENGLTVNYFPEKI